MPVSLKSLLAESELETPAWAVLLVATPVSVSTGFMDTACFSAVATVATSSGSRAVLLVAVGVGVEASTVATPVSVSTDFTGSGCLSAIATVGTVALVAGVGRSAAVACALLLEAYLYERSAAARASCGDRTSVIVDVDTLPPALVSAPASWRIRDGGGDGGGAAADARCT